MSDSKYILYSQCDNFTEWEFKKNKIKSEDRTDQEKDKELKNHYNNKNK